ncbi:aminodeoxychorismate synthase component I [Marinihelvus fidelis]|uniref:Aminodeoxychorismate synthase component I n=1 Tax=Marinihelvus fidelis TaxID=2613842 RepID=A0A5N0TB90_9GAMM|nr:aminodeoxychorismate synthase component I [Marinihelvus fidelis]KAA9132011.1 aminodeoxychorismate synthase component I [Marinihelvus fidelis]
MTAPRPVTLDRVPDLVALSATQSGTYPFLLDSAATGHLGRYSLLLRHTGESLVKTRQGSDSTVFLAELKATLAASSAPHDAESTLPFIGGWFIYLGYELAAEIEPVLELPASPDGLPVAIAARCDGAVIVEHGDQPTAFVIAESDKTLAAMLADIAHAQGDVAGDPARRDSAATDNVDIAELRAEPAAEFEASVRRIHEYLLDGDVFQVNLSRGWQGRFSRTVDASHLYRRLARANPAPFAGMMRWGDRVLMSSSPERLVEVRGREVQTRPIAGTHPRGADAESDRALRQAMIDHPKERAEHIMLIDLERNDLGRVCEPGSVEVDELMVVESYAHVHHIVSNVRGRLRDGQDAVDVIRAVFPGGTITGCPKVRCMQIIAELEGQGRGYYTGAMGYIDHRGHMDLNILIRSLVTDGTGFRFRTGAGIVADSDPAREVEETRHKARGLMRALGATGEGE